VAAAVPPGYRVRLAIEVTGAGLRFQWLRGGRAFGKPQATPSLEVLVPPTAKPGEVIVFAVTCSNAAGTVRSADAVITVKAP
jgi:hypothetical protein